jgi:hypothetical protein
VINRHSLRSRLDRLERRQCPPVPGSVPPQFWAAITGTVPIDHLDTETRRLVEALYGRNDDLEPVEQRIAEGSGSGAVRSATPTFSTGDLP